MDSKYFIDWSLYDRPRACRDGILGGDILSRLLGGEGTRTAMDENETQGCVIAQLNKDLVNFNSVLVQ